MSDDINKRSSSAMIDLFIVAVVTFGADALAIALDLFDRFMTWTRPFEDLEIDELPVAIFVLGLGSAWYAYRRRQELKVEVQRREQSETALVESEQRYRHLVEESQGFICVHDPDGTLLSVNPAAANALGYSVDELIGSNLRELLSPSKQHLFASYLERIQQQITDTGLMTVTTKTGAELIWLYQNRWHDQDGQAPYVLGFAQDVTKRIQTEQALKQSEERFRDLIEGSVQGILIQQDYQALFANQAYADIFGYETPDDLYRLDSVASLIAPHEQERLLQYQEALLAGEWAPEHYEYQGVRQDGTFVWLDIKVRKVLWNESPAIQSVVYDITQRKCAEAERKRLEEQLRQSQKMETMGTLASGIAHDFNNILTAIFANTELAQALIPSDSPVQTHHHEILNATERAKTLVQQILTFSHQTAVQRQAVALAPLIHETFSLLRASLPSTIDFRYNLSEEVGCVNGDPTQLQQVLVNLCTNAEHAMRTTGGLLELRVKALELSDTDVAQGIVPAPGSYLQVTVKDTGSGIAPEVQARMFDPFFTTKSVGEGTGMGLALVHAIITSHGGAITVDTTVDEGTTFSLYLPHMRESDRRESESAPTAPSPTASRGAGRLLLVDDESGLVQSIQNMLVMLGYEVYAYAVAQEALNAFEATPDQFDLVITDQTMPHLTGEQLAQALRRIRPDIPIILCTGFSHVMDVDRAQTLGLDAFCMKPLQVRELAITIQQVLSQRATSRSVAMPRILLIDDDDQLRTGLRQLLESVGYTVGEARNGYEGLQSYRQAPADVVITDILMPEQEGIQTIQQLLQHNPTIKIIAISGGIPQANTDFLDAALLFGAQQTLRKPFRQQELLDAVETVLTA